MDNQLEQIFTNELEKGLPLASKGGIGGNTNPSRTSGRQKPFVEFQRKLNSCLHGHYDLFIEKYDCFWYSIGGVQKVQSCKLNTITTWLL